MHVPLFVLDGMPAAQSVTQTMGFVRMEMLRLP